MKTNTTDISSYCGLFNNYFKEHPLLIQLRHRPDTNHLPQSTATLGPPQKISWEENEAKRYIMIRCIDRLEEGLVDIEVTSPRLGHPGEPKALTDTLVYMVHQCFDDLPEKYHPKKGGVYEAPQVTMKWTPPDLTSFADALYDITRIAEEVLQLRLRAESRFDDINRTIQENNEMLSLWIKKQLQPVQG